jgi:hypothetical protein
MPTAQFEGVEGGLKGFKNDPQLPQIDPTQISNHLCRFSIFYCMKDIYLHTTVVSIQIRIYSQIVNIHSWQFNERSGIVYPRKKD